MAKKEPNGKNMVERRYEEPEIERMRKRVVEIHDQLDGIKEKRKALLDEEKETRINLKRGYDLVEGEELPFTKRNPREDART